jgi:menaquinone-dependent protoporphyrinogen oxidase
MRICIAWGSKLGGTESIALMLAHDLQAHGHDVTACSADDIRRLRDVDAVVVGGALYANRWHRAARQFVARNEDVLRTVPTWFFSSGPLDDSAARGEISPVRQVAILMERVGALGHRTFGGRLEPDVRGFPASAMAKKHAGDWRDPAMIREWAADIARTLPFAKPAAPVAQPGHSLVSLAVHAGTGWVLCAIAMTVLMATVPTMSALVMHLVLVPVIFAAVARHYFDARGAREPIVTAAVFVATVAILDVSMIAGVAGQHALLRSAIGFWIPLLAIFMTTAAVGVFVSARSPETRRSHTDRRAT